MERVRRPRQTARHHKYFILCANTLGGCYGTTGPASIDPRTGKPYGSRFPHVTARDAIAATMPLLDHHGIDCLHAIVAPSIGGMLALTFATLHPDRVRVIIPIASGAKTTVLNRLILFEQVLAIENDPHFQGGDYYDRQPPALGLALARMISHKTFVHLDAIERRAKRTVIQSNDHFDWYQLRDPVESYILHQGKSFVNRFDANSYLRFTELWSGYDPVKEGNAEDMQDLLSRCKAAGHHFLVFTIDSDFCFYPEEQAALVHQLRRAGVSTMHVTVHSDKGHDSFLLEPELYAPHSSTRLRGASASPSLLAGHPPGKLAPLLPTLTVVTPTFNRTPEGGGRTQCLAGREETPRARGIPGRGADRVGRPGNRRAPCWWMPACRSAGSPKSRFRIGAAMIWWPRAERAGHRSGAGSTSPKS